jgi:hypothetical protein
MRKPVSKKSNKPRVPKTVHILGRKFKVSIKKEEIHADGKVASGSCSWINKEIEIEAGLPLNEQLGILAHEMGHATLDINGLSETLTPKEVEIICQTCRSVVEDFIKAFHKS